MIKSVIAGAGIATVLFAVPLSAQAKDADVARASVAADSLNCTGCVWQTQIADPVEKVLRTPTANSVWSYALNPNIVTEEKLAPEVREKLNAPDEVGADVKGGAQTLFQSDPNAPTEIANIGGTFSTRHTSVGQFTLPQGTWLVTLSAKFNRKVASAAGDPDVQPMLQISSGGAHFVTIMGNSISPALDADLTGSAVALITVGGDMVFDVNAFGYNSVRGSQGSGEITVLANVVAARA